MAETTEPKKGKSLYNVRTKEEQAARAKEKRLKGQGWSSLELRVIEDLLDAVSIILGEPEEFRLKREEAERIRAAKFPPRDFSAPYDMTDPRPKWYKAHCMKADGTTLA